MTISSIEEINTPRLILRQWQESDKIHFARLNADQEVMKFFPRKLTAEESGAMADRIRVGIDEKGWGFWAVELKSENQFIGFIGVNQPMYNLPFSPCIEIGWRLARQYWGSGLATEGARAALNIAFSKLEFDEIVSFTPLINIPSISVMKKLGMTDSNQNFIHPQVPEDSSLSEHVLYKITKDEWNHLADDNQYESIR